MTIAPSGLARMRQNQRVESIVDERPDGGVVCTLRKGWSFHPKREERVYQANSVAELRAIIVNTWRFNDPAGL
jgi:hypothetical protein